MRLVIAFTTVFFWLLLACVCVSFAQQKPVKFERLTSEQGLPQSVVYSIMQDHKGFIWLGTQEGLIRYDGYNFVSYTHDPLDSTSLSENRVLCVVEDKAGTIWVGTGNGGLNRFDRTTNTFTSFHANPADPTSISSNRIYYILEDKQGMLWIATDNGLNKFDPTTKRFTCYKTVENPTNDKAGNSSADNIRAIVEDPDSTILWLGTGKGLKKFNKATGTCVATYQH